MSSALQPTDNATKQQVAALELQVAAREAELTAFKTALQQLQTRYLDKIGPLYAELIPLDAAVAEAEIKAGLRSPEPDEPDFEVRTSKFEVPNCGPASAPSGDLKRMFRDVVKAVHPDLSGDHHQDERTRFRRHSLMAEANRAFAERDEDRLRLILRAWTMDPDLAGIAGGGPDADQARLQRRASALSTHLVQIEAELADLRRSAIARLKARIDEAQAQGWDLFAEMIRQVQREIAVGKATLARLARRKRHRAE